MEEKYLDCGKFLGFSIEEMEDRIIASLCIYHAVSGNAIEVAEKKRVPIEEQKGGGNLVV